MVYHTITRVVFCFPFLVVLGGQIPIGQRRVFEFCADARGRGHRTVLGRFDRAERQAVAASVEIDGVIRAERVHDEDFDQRVRTTWPPRRIVI